jgi:hypothetical protein
MCFLNNFDMLIKKHYKKIILIYYKLKKYWQPQLFF